MIDIKSLIEQEDVEEVVCFFASGTKGIDYRALDRLFVRYRFEVISEGTLLNAVKTLSKSGQIQSKEHSMVLLKGPNWINPSFANEKKYGIT